MGIILKQTDNRSKYQEKIAAELQDRLKNKTEDVDLPDHVKDSAYLEGTKQTSFLTGVWLVLAILSVIVIGFMVYRSISG
jgi:hypothetical protein